MKEQSKKQKIAKNQDETAGNEAAAGEPKEENTYRLNTGSLPAIMMLSGGALASIVTYINRYTLAETLKIVLLSLVIFYILGRVLKRVFDSFRIIKKKKEESSSEGEVIEKNPDSPAEETSEAGKQ